MLLCKFRPVINRRMAWHGFANSKIFWKLGLFSIHGPIPSTQTELRKKFPVSAASTLTAKTCRWRYTAFSVDVRYLYSHLFLPPYFFSLQERMMMMMMSCRNVNRGCSNIFGNINQPSATNFYFLFPLSTPVLTFLESK